MMRQLIEQQRARHYADFGGAVIRGRIPIPEAVVNEVLGAALSGSSVVRDVHVILHGNQRIEVNLAIHKWFFRKRVALELVLEPVVVFAHSPIIRLWLPPAHHFLRSLAHLLTTLGAGLPRWVRVTGQLLEIDLGELLHDQGLPEVISWLRFLAIEGHRGVLLVLVELSVGIAANADGGTHDGQHRRSAVSVSG